MEPEYGDLAFFGPPFVENCLQGLKAVGILRLSPAGLSSACASGDLPEYLPEYLEEARYELTAYGAGKVTQSMNLPECGLNRSVSSV